MKTATINGCQLLLIYDLFQFLRGCVNRLHIDPACADKLRKNPRGFNRNTVAYVKSRLSGLGCVSGMQWLWRSKLAAFAKAHRSLLTNEAHKYSWSASALVNDVVGTSLLVGDFNAETDGVRFRVFLENIALGWITEADLKGVAS